ncbi:hypothetical protein ACSBR1_015417 [Camellia fascicularis]
MSNTQRLMAASTIVKDEDKVDLFFCLDENDKMEWVSLLLKGMAGKQAYYVEFVEMIRKIYNS